MKVLPALLLAGTILMSPALFAAGESVQQILEDAQRAMARGDTAAAKRNFEIVRQLDPKNPTANNFLGIIRAQEAKTPKGNDTEKQLAAVILPKLDVREATLGEVFDYLRQQVPKITGGKQNVNFVLQLSEEQLRAQVTLQLANIPFTVALQYLSDLAAVQIEYQKYAVKVTPKGGGPVTTGKAPAPTAPVAPAVPGLQ